MSLTQLYQLHQLTSVTNPLLSVVIPQKSVVFCSRACFSFPSLLLVLFGCSAECVSIFPENHREIRTISIRGVFSYVATDLVSTSGRVYPRIGPSKTVSCGAGWLLGHGKGAHRLRIVNKANIPFVLRFVRSSGGGVFLFAKEPRLLSSYRLAPRSNP